MKIVFDIFDIMIDVRYGNFLTLPFEGGAAAQPALTMDALSLIRALFRKELYERQKAANERVKNMNAHPRIRRR